MGDSAKKALSERDICTKYITPALVAGNKWDQSQIREEVSFTKGRVLVRGKKSTRGEAKRADFILSYKPGIRLAVIKAKDNNHPVGGGKVGELMSWCDALEARLATAQTTATTLLNATLDQILAI
jgi:type I site-specific restriction endonuclease